MTERGDGGKGTDPRPASESSQANRGMGRTNEPLWWALFVLGGTAALLIPVNVILTGIAVFAGWLSEAALWKLLHSPFLRVYLFLTMAFPLFHAVHRIRLFLRDEGLRRYDRSWLSRICYGTAALGTILALVLLLRL
jgi:fumarate reductase subunit D